jgi:hypothetical protein
MNKHRRLGPAGQGGGFVLREVLSAAATTAYMIGL